MSSKKYRSSFVVLSSDEEMSTDDESEIETESEQDSDKSGSDESSSESSSEGSTSDEESIEILDEESNKGSDDEIDKNSDDEDYSPKDTINYDLESEMPKVCTMPESERVKVPLLKDKETVLKFFNNSTYEEVYPLARTTAQSKMKSIKIVMSLAPFEDYSSLTSALSKNNLFTLVETINDSLYARGVLNNVLSKCESISKNLEKHIESIIGKKSDSSNLLKQPALLNKSLTLKPYQIIGYNWLRAIYNQGLSGILADEMGLGKTCQTIAFLANMMEQNPRQAILIMVPPSVLDNWERELTAWLPSLKIMKYTGSMPEREKLREKIKNKFRKTFNCILTSYSFFTNKLDSHFFRNINFDYCVFDEGHILKNMKSLKFKALIKVKSKQKLMLTGTPIQNNFMELISLLSFLMPGIFYKKIDHFKNIFDASIIGKDDATEKQSFYREKIKQIRQIIKPFILRRIKTEVLKDLPNKHEDNVFCEMTNYQKKVYDNIITEFRAELIENEGRKRNKAMSAFMELRKAACHPLMIRSYYNDKKMAKMARIITDQSDKDTVYELVLEDMTVCSDYEIYQLCFDYKGLDSFKLDLNKYMYESSKIRKLDEIVDEIKKGQFLGTLDIIEDYLHMKSLKFVRLDGSTKISFRQGLIDKFNNTKDIFAFLITTKAGGCGINLTSANHVVIFDQDYNPFNDKQAQDRCHRVGQTKEVKVYNLMTTGSVDEGILKIKEHKLELEDDINGKGKNSTKEKMNKLIDFLFELSV